MGVLRRGAKSANYRLRRAAHDLARFDPVTRRRLPSRDAWVRLGGQCGWLAPVRWETAAPVCYCVGAGEDISFDLALAGNGARVVIVDPTPRAIAHVVPLVSGNPQVRFLPYALWSQDCEVTLYEPRDASHVSHSIVNLQGTTKGFKAPGRTLQTIMSECGHTSIDLLKIDIEGAEYAVLRDVIAQAIPIGIIAVEFDELSYPTRGAWRRIRAMTDEMRDAGYHLSAVDSGSNYTFVESTYRSLIGLGGC